MKCHTVGIVTILASLLLQTAHAATTQAQYYGHPAREDSNGVIAPWYSGLNGQMDFRVRVSADTLKRYPWADTDKAVMAAPHFVYTSMWSIDADGHIGTPPIEDWMCGDLGQRTVSLINGLADYYRYSSDPAAIGFITLQADYILGYALTPADHPWPRFPISCPTKGKPYGQCDPTGLIQLDLSADIGASILRAFQITGDARYLDAAKHWGDVLVQHCDITPGAAPWNRYANPEQAKWSNQLTGSVTMILRFLDQLIRLGYPGRDNAVVRARDAGRSYLDSTLFPRWTTPDTWGRCYWDWECPVFSLVNGWAMKYVLDQHEAFPKWQTDTRNVLTLIFNRTGVDPGSAGEVYSGAWAIPESPSCCGVSLSYGQQLIGSVLAQYAALTSDPWARELARRMAIEGSYDALDNGAVIDGITGVPIVAGSWLNIIHPLAMRQALHTMAWLPDLFGPNRENHIMRSSAEVVSVTYAKGRVAYKTYDAPEQTTDVLRLAFSPTLVMADGQSLAKRGDLSANGYTLAALSNGDYIVSIRHDGLRHVVIEGDDPQTAEDIVHLTFTGAWTDTQYEGGSGRVSEQSDAAVACSFTGNQVRVIGCVEPAGGLAHVYLDGAKERAEIDCWNPMALHGQVLFARSGLTCGSHELKVVVRGAKNLRAQGAKVCIDGVQHSAAMGDSGYGAGEGPKDVQRMVFGYTGREDLRDAAGQLWRPATEWVLRLGPNADSVGAAWWTAPAEVRLEGTDSPDLYRYGVHAPEFVVNVTVAPGTYYAKFKFASTRGLDTARNRVTVLINGQPAIDKLDVAAMAGGPNRALDMQFDKLTPCNGIIEFRFTGGDKDAGIAGEAFIQALEVGITR
jgi:hypothetical protein